MHFTLTHFWDGNKDLECHKTKINKKKKYIIYEEKNHLLSWIIMPQEARLFTPNSGQKKQIIPLSFVALFTRVLKPERCFLIVVLGPSDLGVIG